MQHSAKKKRTMNHNNFQKNINSNHWLLREAKKPKPNNPGGLNTPAHFAARNFASHLIDIIKRHRKNTPTDPKSAGEQQATDNAMELMDIAQRHGAGVDARRIYGRNTPPKRKG